MIKRISALIVFIAIITCILAGITGTCPYLHSLFMGL